jgi:hypothetical protein
VVTMRSADLIVHYEVFYYGVVPHYEPHSWTSARCVTHGVMLLCWGHWFLPGTASVDVILTRLFIVCFRAFPPFFKVARALAIYLIDTRILRWMSGHFIYLFMPGYCKSKSSRRFLPGFHIHYICDVCHGLTNCLLCERRSFPCAGVWCSCRRPGLTDVTPVFVRGRTSRRDAIMVIDDEPLASHDFSKQFSDLPDAPPPPSPPASPPPGRSESPQQMMGLEDESGDLNLTAPAPLHFGQPLLILPHGHQDYTHASVGYNSACVCPACVPVVSPDIPSGTDDFPHAMFEHLNIQCLCAECTPLEGAPADENVYHVPPEDVETDSSTDEDMPELVPGSDNSDSR